MRVLLGELFGGPSGFGFLIASGDHRSTLIPVVIGYSVALFMD
jgi:selenocysteine lyase/cysteine desulfurase